MSIQPSRTSFEQKTETTLLLVRKEQIPKVEDMTVLIQQDSAAKKDTKKKNFDTHDGVHELPELCPGELVWIKDRKEDRKVIDSISCIVNTQDGMVRRNKHHLVHYQKSCQVRT